MNLTIPMKRLLEKLHSAQGGCITILDMDPWPFDEEIAMAARKAGLVYVSTGGGWNVATSISSRE